jgi:hypothetical protein
MLNDIRIVCLQRDGIEIFQVSRVLYKEDGDVFYAENPYSEYESLEEAYTFLDQMYKASLKPVLVVQPDGSYE